MASNKRLNRVFFKASGERIIFYIESQEANQLEYKMKNIDVKVTVVLGRLKNEGFLVSLCAFNFSWKT